MHFLAQHLTASVLGGFFLFSNLVGAMEEPTAKSGPFYRYIYRLGHGLAGNLKYALRAKFPEFVEPDAQK